MYSKGTNENGSTQLEYRPEFIGLLQSGYKFPVGLTPVFEIETTGQQWAINSLGIMQKIEPQLLANLRISYRFSIGNSFPEMYLRCKNLFDQPVLSKIGLPNAGRMFTAGIVVRI